jgi:hypothetical protein
MQLGESLKGSASKGYVAKYADDVAILINGKLSQIVS